MFEHMNSLTNAIVWLDIKNIPDFVADDEHAPHELINNSEAYLSKTDVNYRIEIYPKYGSWLCTSWQDDEMESKRSL